MTSNVFLLLFLRNKMKLSVLSHTQVIPGIEPRSRPELSNDISSSLLRNKEDGQEDYFIIAGKMPVASTKRLVVILPDGDVDEYAVAQLVWVLASTFQANILYLALSPDVNSVPYIRRSLANLVSITSFDKVKANETVIVGNNWLNSIQEVLEAGDLLVCLALHRTKTSLIRWKPLGEHLSESLGLTVVMLKNIHVGISPKNLSSLRDISAIFASTTVLIGFAFGQIWVDQTFAKPLSGIFLCLSIVFELTMLLKVNELIG